MSGAETASDSASNSLRPSTQTAAGLDTLAEDEIFGHVTAVEVPLFRQPGDATPLAIVRAGSALELSERETPELRFVGVPLPVLRTPGSFPSGEPEHLAGWIPKRARPTHSLTHRALEPPARYGLVRTLALEPGGEPFSFTHCGSVREFESDPSGKYTRVAAEWPAGVVFGWMPRALAGETDLTCQALLAGRQTAGLPEGYVPPPARMPSAFARFVAQRGTFYWGSDPVEGYERRCIAFRFDTSAPRSGKLAIKGSELPSSIRSASLSYALDPKFPFVTIGCQTTVFADGVTLASGCVWSYAVTSIDANAVRLFPWAMPSWALGEPKPTLGGYRPDKTVAWYRSRDACEAASPNADPEPRPTLPPDPTRAKHTLGAASAQLHAERDTAARVDSATELDSAARLKAPHVVASADPVDTLQIDARFGHVTTRAVPVFHARGDTDAIGFLRAAVPVTLVSTDADFYQVRATFPVVESASGFPKNQVQQLPLWVPRRWAPNAPVLPGALHDETLRPNSVRQGVVRTLSLSAGGEPWTAVTCGPFWELESDPSGRHARVLAEWPSGALLGWMNNAEPAVMDFECKRAVYPEQSSFPAPEEYLGVPPRLPDAIVNWVNAGGTLYWGTGNADRRCVAFRFSPKTREAGRLLAEPMDLPAGQRRASLDYELHSTLPFITLGCLETSGSLSQRSLHASACAHDYALVSLLQDRYVALVPWSSPPDTQDATSTLAGYDHRATSLWYLSREECEKGSPARDPEPRVRFVPATAPSSRGGE